MCKNCEKLKQEIKELKTQFEDEKQYKTANYKAFQELREKFERLAVSYCYLTDVGNPLE